MNERNPIVYFEEDGEECLTSHDWCGKILDIKPHLTDWGHLTWVEFVLEKFPEYGMYSIAYQKSFKIRFLDGQEFEFKGTWGAMLMTIWNLTRSFSSSLKISITVSMNPILISK